MTSTIWVGAPRPRLVAATLWRLGVGFLVALALLVMGGGSSSVPSNPIAWLRGAAAAVAAAPGCEPPSGWRSTKAVSVPGVSSDFDLRSFDGTTIRIHWFPNPTAHPEPAAHPYPTVLMGPGWGLTGDTNVSQAGIQGALSIARLWQSGFNVLTWDPRGFGKSGGAAEVDSPNDEGRDVSAMLNWVAQQPGVELDHPGVPRVGMVGESYGGGIQFATAARDCRVDAIAPTIAWNSLKTSLDKNLTPKEGWANILDGVSSSAKLDPEITAASHDMTSTGVIDAQAAFFFESRGPAQFLTGVKVPTLILQGTVDNLFTLDEGIANYDALRKQGTTVSMAWFCGGHGVCLTNPGSAIDVASLSLAWMEHYVGRDSSVHVLNGFAFVDQNGTSFAAPSYPLQPAAPIASTASGSLALTAGGGSGPPAVKPNAQAANVVDAVADRVTPGPATNALNIAVPMNHGATVVGAPKLTLTYSGTAPGTRPARVFAQLVDPATKIVVNNQITPVPLTLDGRSHTATVPLETIAYTAKAGSSLELQLVATTVAYLTPRLDGTVDFSRVKVVLPTVKGLSVLRSS